jgi:hypothetical protein
MTLGHHFLHFSWIHGDEIPVLDKKWPRSCGELRGHKTLVVFVPHKAFAFSGNASRQYIRGRRQCLNAEYVSVATGECRQC